MSEFQDSSNNLWIVKGPDVRDFGVMFTTRKTVVKLSDGSLCVDSTVSLASDALKRIDELGRVKYLVAALSRHVWRLEEWHNLFPTAQPSIDRKPPIS